MYFQMNGEDWDYTKNGDLRRFCSTLGYNFDRVFVQSSQGRKVTECIPLS